MQHWVLIVCIFGIALAALTSTMLSTVLNIWLKLVIVVMCSLIILAWWYLDKVMVTSARLLMNL